MNRNQWITMAVAALNLVLIALFPPFDWLSSTTRGTPAFAGFGFVFIEHGHQQVNWSFLQLEFFVVLANAAIAWLLLFHRSGPVILPASDRARMAAELRR